MLFNMFDIIAGPLNMKVIINGTLKISDQFLMCLRKPRT